MTLTAVEIPPFVTPVSDSTISEMDFSVAVDDWNENLSRILKHNTKAFWIELLQNQSLSRFLNSFLGEYASFRGNKDDIWIMELEEVVRRVFMIYYRMSETMTDSHVTALLGETTNPIASLGFDDVGSALLDTGLVSTSVLMDLAGIYGSSDPEGVSKIVSIFLQNAPSLINDFRTSTGTVVQIIRRVQKKVEKGSSGGSGGSGAGKGKGKGKSVSPAAPASPEPSTPEQDQERRTEAFQYASVLANVAYSLDSVSKVSPTLAMELHQHDTFLQCLFGCYNYTLPVLTKALIESTTGGEFKSQAVLNFLRLRMLSIVSNILDGIVKEYQLTEGDDGDEDSKASLTDKICGLIADVEEQSPLQDDMVPMFDAPIILDLEIQCGLSEKLSMWITDVFHGENDRIAFWVERLRNLLSFNPATMSYLDEHNMRKSEKMARAMSQLYINEEKSRSGSTIHSGSHMATPPPLPARNNNQDEDYIKRTMLISQLQDLFPDLGDGFLEACLITFKDDPEVVTMHLLEEDLPSDLATMDRSAPRALQQARLAPESMAVVKVPEVLVEQDVLSNRRNIFDGDEFDVFSGNQVDKTKVSRGKRGPKDVETVLDDKSFVTQQKSAILKAVESMYDDEYDDTYDSMGLTNNTETSFKLVDAVNEDESNNTQPKQSLMDPSIEHEEVLVNMYTSNKDVFNRNAETRRSKKRQELRNLTKMSDEQLEGWAVMFSRNPRKEVIAQKYEFNGQQTELESAEPIDKRRGGRLPFVDRNASSSPQPRQKNQLQQTKQQNQQQKQQGQSGNKPSKNGPKKPQQPKQQQQQQAGSGQNPSQQNQQQQQQKQQQGPKTSQSDRAKNERQKASKANHNRRNAHAKKMASMNP
ncbi:hypothetical protein FBU30_007150 [Linnemannia zychae]|nr:hypothetical protein FBU30_007150 [Linnemannia zychae]